MIDLTGRRLWAYAAPADLRNGHAGLYDLARHALRRHGCDIDGGDVVIFVNGFQTICKVLYKDDPVNPSSPWVIIHKRADRVTFPAVWEQSKKHAMELSMRELRAIFAGAREVRQVTKLPHRKAA